MYEAVDETEMEGSHLTLSIWHPDCWTLQVTESRNGGLFGHGVYHVDGSVKGRFTAYANNEAELDELVSAIEKSPLTESVWHLDYRHEFDKQLKSPGNTSKSILVQYGESRSINDALVSNGFIPDEAVWIHDGREYWNVVIDADRDRIQDRIDAISDEMDADIEIQHITTGNRDTGGVLQRGILSERQREVFKLARERGYYEWPREVSAKELADELGVSKATTLEHLRKAEAKIMNSLP